MITVHDIFECFPVNHFICLNYFMLLCIINIINCIINFILNMKKGSETLPLNSFL